MIKQISKGEIVIPADADDIWEHELSTARALAKAGYKVESLPTDNSTTMPDIVMDGVNWEIKAPKTDKLSAVERNLKRATKQSGNIIIDSCRLSKLQDRVVQKFLVSKFKHQKAIKRLIFVNRKREVVVDMRD